MIPNMKDIAVTPQLIEKVKEDVSKAFGVPANRLGNSIDQTFAAGKLTGREFDHLAGFGKGQL